MDNNSTDINNTNNDLSPHTITLTLNLSPHTIPFTPNHWTHIFKSTIFLVGNPGPDFGQEYKQIWQSKSPQIIEKKTPWHMKLEILILDWDRNK